MRFIYSSLRTSSRFIFFSTGLFGLVLFYPAPAICAESIANVSPERAAAATAHYARARALLVEALSEFEHASRIANPDVLVDSQRWRRSIVSRAEDLNRVLDPKPRVTRSGVRMKANSRLIYHGRSRNQEVLDKVSSDNGVIDSGSSKARAAVKASRQALEEKKITQVEREKKEEPSRSRLVDFSKPKEPAKKVEIIAPKKQEEERAVSAAYDPKTQLPEADGESIDLEQELYDEDPEIAKAIANAIQSRLKKLETDESVEQ